MGCFLSCFRGGSDPSRDLRDPLVRESRLGDAFLNDEKKFDEATGKLDAETANGLALDEELRREDPLVRESRLGDAFLNDEKKFDEATGKLDAEAANGHGVHEELRREANFLKSCGTISQMPPEILNSIPVNSEDANDCGDSPANLQVMKDAVLLEENASEILHSDEHDVSRHEQVTDESTLRVASESQSSLEDKPSPENVRDRSTDSSDSPYPTPLVLRGDIQTPGTVYTAYKETSKPGKRTRASRQFIYPVLRPIENKMQWMELKAQSPLLASNPPKRRNLSADSSEKAQQTFASSTVTETESSEYVSFPIYDNFAAQNEAMSPEESKGQNINQLLDEGEESSKQSSEYGKHGVTSLSHWLKPSSADDESNSRPDDGNVGKEIWYETSVSDVPIFPAFGLNWETENPTPVLPKPWDGNGIPNTTTKYKEDQKVSWHATPFEERLLKVLSDEKPRHERAFSGKLIHLEENTE